VGYKALAVNLSDLAAMAARPLAAFVSLLVPTENGLAVAESLTEGMLELADRFALSIAGGDTNSWRGPLVVNITAIGEVTARGPLLRAGAKPGDVLIVTGRLGGSILGRHLSFTPRVDESLVLCQRYTVHAGMDISDGLTFDLARMMSASGCGAELDLDAIPISSAAHQLAASDGTSALQHALGDGEDFELLLAVPPGDAKQMLGQRPIESELTAIGRCIDQPGLWQRSADGSLREMAPMGYQHPL
jgi:thiamine-monophosphate kinase